MWYNCTVITSGGLRFVRVIDSLSAGFGTVVRRIWLLAIPVALDLFLWLGVRLSIEPLILGWLSMVESVPASSGSGILPEEGKEALLQLAAQSNLFSLLKVPALLAQNSSAGWLPPVGEEGLEGAGVFAGIHPSVMEVGNLASLLGIAVVLLLAGLFISTLYLSLIAQVIRREEDEPWFPSLRSIGVTWRRLLVYALALVLVLVMMGVPLSALVAMAALTGQSLVMLVLNFSLLVFMWAWIWLMLYLFFAVDAIVLNQVGVWAGVWTSLQVVRRNFWPTVGLFVLSNVIAAGTAVVWGRLASSPWGVLASILGSGFIQTGLVAASLFFFRSRHAQLVGAEAAAADD